MASSGSPSLDVRLLISFARAIAIDVAAEQDLFLSPDALGAVDILVDERLGVLNELVQQQRFDLKRWQNHVRVVARRVAGEFQQESIRRVTTPEQVLMRVRPALAVYPYD